MIQFLILFVVGFLVCFFSFPRPSMTMVTAGGDKRGATVVLIKKLVPTEEKKNQHPTSNKSRTTTHTRAHARTHARIFSLHVRTTSWGYPPPQRCLPLRFLTDNLVVVIVVGGGGGNETR